MPTNQDFFRVPKSFGYQIPLQGFLYIKLAMFGPLCLEFLMNCPSITKTFPAKSMIIVSIKSKLQKHSFHLFFIAKLLCSFFTLYCLIFKI